MRRREGRGRRADGPRSVSSATIWLMIFLSWRYWTADCLRSGGRARRSWAYVLEKCIVERTMAHPATEALPNLWPLARRIGLDASDAPVPGAKRPTDVTALAAGRSDSSPLPRTLTKTLKLTLEPR